MSVANEPLVPAPRSIRLPALHGPAAVVLAVPALVIGYIGVAAAGQRLGEFGALSVWYLPAGISLAVSMLWGPRWWPALAAAELITGVVVFHIDRGQFGWTLMTVNAIGYTGVYVLAGCMLRRLGIVSRADRLRDALVVVAVGAGIAPLAAAMFGVAMQLWARITTGGEYWMDVRIWWVGDALGVATIAPAAMLGGLIAGIGGRGFIPPSLRRDPPVLTVLELVAPAVSAVLVFELWGSQPAVLSLLMAPLVFVALRFGGAGTSLATLALAPTMTVMADRTVGNLLVTRAGLQVLLLGIVVVGFVVGAVVDERERVSQRQRELAQIVEATSDLVAVVRTDGHVQYVNPAGRRMARCAGQGDWKVIREADLYAAGTSEQLVEGARRAAIRDGAWSGEVDLHGPGGERIPASKVVIAHYGVDGNPLRTTSVVRDVAEQRRLQDELEHRTFADPLTGLPNRAGFLRELAEAERRLLYGTAVGAVLVVQLDRIPDLEAAIGRERTEQAIKVTGRRLVLVGGATAIVGRIGNATFGLIPGEPMPERDALDLAHRAVEELTESPVWPGEQIVLRANAGVAKAPGLQMQEGELLWAAEVAAHRAASTGMRVLYHDETVSEAARHALDLETRLRTAMEQRSWRLAFQPIVSAPTLEVRAAEALLRFGADDLGDSPYPFVLLAEERGLIVKLGREVLAAACDEATHWPDRIAVNVNVSRHQLCDDTFISDIEHVLMDTGLPPSRLTLEITESAATGGPRQMADVLDAVRALGARVALDDFGTGYSSLATLDSLPIDILKLDACFTRGLAASPRKRNLVGATIALARGLGICVTAEGVEGGDELQTFVNLGCDEVQGYFIAYPAAPHPLRSLPAR